MFIFRRTDSWKWESTVNPPESKYRRISRIHRIFRKRKYVFFRKIYQRSCDPWQQIKRKSWWIFEEEVVSPAETVGWFSWIESGFSTSYNPPTKKETSPWGSSRFKRFWRLKEQVRKKQKSKWKEKVTLLSTDFCRSYVNFGCFFCKTFLELFDLAQIFQKTYFWRRFFESFFSEMQFQMFSYSNCICIDMLILYF